MRQQKSVLKGLNNGEGGSAALKLHKNKNIVTDVAESEPDDRVFLSLSTLEKHAKNLSGTTEHLHMHFHLYFRHKWSI